MHLNALNRMKVCTGKKEMETLINSFVYSNFNYSLLVWHFIPHANPRTKLKKYTSHHALSRLITRPLLHYVTPETDTPLYHLFHVFEVEK